MGWRRLEKGNGGADVQRWGSSSGDGSRRHHRGWWSDVVARQR
jgi:hypothetical protein